MADNIEILQRELELVEQHLLALRDDASDDEPRDESGKWTDGGGGGGHAATADEHYHGTSVKNAMAILKTGLKPTDDTDRSIGKASYISNSRDLAHIYAAGKAGKSKEVALIVFKDPAKAGFKKLSGRNNVRYSRETITPDKIDRVEIYAKDAKKGDAPLRVLRSHADFNDDQPRDEGGRFASSGGGGAGGLAKKAHENGGFTYSPTTGNFPSEGYAVSIHPEHEQKWKGKDSLNADHVKEYLDQRKEFFGSHPNANLGGWYNADDDTWYLDVSHVTNDKQEAVSLGSRYNQKGVYDLKEGRTITDSEYGEIAAGERGDSASWCDTRVFRPAHTEPGRDRRAHEADPGRGTGQARTAGRLDFDEDQPRDENGRWGGSGGTWSSGSGEQPTMSKPHVILGRNGGGKIIYRSPETEPGYDGLANAVAKEHGITDASRFYHAQTGTTATSITNGKMFNTHAEAEKWVKGQLNKQKVSIRLPKRPGPDAAAEDVAWHHVKVLDELAHHHPELAPLQKEARNIWKEHSWSIKPEHISALKALDDQSRKQARALSKRKDWSDSQPRAANGEWGDGSEASLTAGHIGIPREKMPQIASDDKPEFFAALRAKGIKVEEGSMKVKDLIATQSDMNMDKVRAMTDTMPPDMLSKPVVVSSDNHVLDGHHRWAALKLRDPDATIQTQKVDMPIHQLVGAARLFPKSFSRTTKDVLDEEVQVLQWRLDAINLRLDFDEDQPRDESGKWTSEGGDGGADQKLTGAGSSAKASAPKTPSAGLKSISEHVGQTFKDLEPSKKAPESKGKEKPAEAKKEATGSGSTAHLEAGPPKIWQGGAKGHKDTEEAYLKNGKWAPERQELHEKYIKDTFEAKKEEKDENGKTKLVPLGHEVPKVDEPTVYMTGGGPASGKTTGLLHNEKAGIPDKSKAAHINADEAKEFLPEYKAGQRAKDKNAASFVHEESSYVAKKGVVDALKAGHHVVFDSTGDSGIDSLEKKVAQMRAQGAKKVVANYATLNVDEAIRRSDARAEKSGRFVPHEYLRANHRDVAKTVQGAIERGTFDNLDVWDTNGRDPVHVASYVKGEGLTIHDKDAWEAFQKRADGQP